MSDSFAATAAARHFQIQGQPLSVVPYGTGHINDTYCALFDEAGLQSRFILQRIHTGIFRNPAALMENIQRVTAHLAAQLSGQSDLSHRPDPSYRSDPSHQSGFERRVLTLIPARDGRMWHEDTDGGHWRVYRFIDRAHTYDTVASVEQAYQAARAFGQFQRMLVDLPAPRLHDTIPDFHNTPMRYKMFEKTLAADVANRALAAKAEIEFALAHQSVVSVLLDAELPERVTHNDTKFNNVLFDDVSGEGICVLDLDTVMPGLSLYDFGDMVRTATSPADEDALDLSKVKMQFPMFEALLRGYLSAAGSFLTAAEKRYLGFAGKLITFEQGIRFLTDYLAGDTYYKVYREGQNLDRCRTQFKLIQSIEEQEEEMQRLVDELAHE